VDPSKKNPVISAAAVSRPSVIYMRMGSDNKNNNNIHNIIYLAMITLVVH